MICGDVGGTGIAASLARKAGEKHHTDGDQQQHDKIEQVARGTGEKHR